MRPIVMDMHGFASFREQTRVDFTDADFFALVGPTGAGKSTVIDAMTFALYGSVPRWGRKGMVSLALAPTVARATVKLVFEVDRQRYVVARELRRTGSQVSQRAASLERIIDPDGLAGKDDKTTPMARDLAGVTGAVERLLGLSYEDFIQCVVLPQGQFADFLHAKPADRQEILLRLLGAEHYKQMMMKANQRASAAAQRAETIGESLLSLRRRNGRVGEPVPCRRRRPGKRSLTGWRKPCRASGNARRSCPLPRTGCGGSAPITRPCPSCACPTASARSTRTWRPAGLTSPGSRTPSRRPSTPTPPPASRLRQDRSGRRFSSLASDAASGTGSTIRSRAWKPRRRGSRRKPKRPLPPWKPARQVLRISVSSVTRRLRMPRPRANR